MSRFSFTEITLGSLLGSLLLLVGAMAAPAGANHSHPATYTGTIEGGGTIEFDVSADGTAVTRFAVTGFPASPCATSIDQTTTGTIAISGDPHAFSTTNYTGTFDAPQHATGTFRFRQTFPSCTTPFRNWTATTTATPPTARLSVSEAGSGSGTVTSSPSGISCPGTCSALFPTGGSVTLSATPAAKSKFSGWSGGGCTGTGTCVVSVDADKTVTATFDAVSAGPPDTRITKTKISGEKHKATFKFTGSGGEGDLRLKCKLDKAKYKSCSSPQTYKHLDEGKHTFRVEAVDSQGTADPSPAKAKFEI